MRWSFFLLSTLILMGCAPQANLPKKHVEMVNCHSPNEMRETKAIIRWKYLLLQEILSTTLAKSPGGMGWLELRSSVERQVPAGKLERIGNLKWHIESVALEMEYRGEVERFPGETSDTKTVMPKNLRIRKST